MEEINILKFPHTCEGCKKSFNVQYTRKSDKLPKKVSVTCPYCGEKLNVELPEDKPRKPKSIYKYSLEELANKAAKHFYPIIPDALHKLPYHIKLLLYVLANILSIALVAAALATIKCIFGVTLLSQQVGAIPWWKIANNWGYFFIGLVVYQLPWVMLGFVVNAVSRKEMSRVFFHPFNMCIWSFLSIDLCILMAIFKMPILVQY